MEKTTTSVSSQLFNLATKMPKEAVKLKKVLHRLASECEESVEKSETSSTSSFEMISQHSSSTYSLQSLLSSCESEGVIVEKDKDGVLQKEEALKKDEALKRKVLETIELQEKQTAKKPSSENETFENPLSLMSCTCPSKDHDNWSLQLQIDHLQAKVAWYEKQEEKVVKEAYPLKHPFSEESLMIASQSMNYHSNDHVIQINDDKTKTKWEKKNELSIFNIHLWMTKDIVCCNSDCMDIV